MLNRLSMLIWGFYVLLPFVFPKVCLSASAKGSKGGEVWPKSFPTPEMRKRPLRLPQDWPKVAGYHAGPIGWDGKSWAHIHTRVMWGAEASVTTLGELLRAIFGVNPRTEVLIRQGRWEQANNLKARDLGYFIDPSLERRVIKEVSAVRVPFQVLLDRIVRSATYKVAYWPDRIDFVPVPAPRVLKRGAFYYFVPTLRNGGAPQRQGKGANVP
jgi:hypothetical protein